MNKWMRRIRGAIGMGVTWAAAWFGAGMITQLGFVLATGSRADAPFPLLFGIFGFVAGVTFSAVLSLVERGRRFDELSIPRFSVWGAVGGLCLSAVFVSVVAIGGDASFMSNLLLLGPVFAIAGAGSAAGSLAIARKAEHAQLTGSHHEIAASSDS